MEEIFFPNGMFRIAPSDIEKPRRLTPPEKIALDLKHSLLTAKAEQRAEICWACDHRAIVWVHEVGFDFKGEKADPVIHNAITSTDYPGPVPGFCLACLGHAPERLAEAVYFDRPEMAWGVRPTRWFVSFTDGTQTGGSILAIDPKQLMPNFLEEHVG